MLKSLFLNPFAAKKLLEVVCLAVIVFVVCLIVPMSTLTRAAPVRSIGQASAVNFMTTKTFTRSQATQSQELGNADMLSIQYVLQTTGNTMTLAYQESNDNTNWFTKTVLAAGVVSGTNGYVVTPTAMYQRFYVSLSNTTSAVTVSLPGMVK